MGKKIRLNSVGYLDGSGTEKDGVYERKVMMVYCGDFDSMDGPVTITEKHIDLLVKNHNSFIENVKRLFNGDLPMKDCPPLQLDHSALATHTIGRLVGPLVKGMANIEGKEVPALFGTARFLGGENIEKAQDGRYTHVSIGADLEDGIINELSVTPFPAAPKASLLSKKRLAQYRGKDYEVVEIAEGEYDIYIDGKKVSHHAGSSEEVDAEAKRYIDSEKGDSQMHEKLKKHLMEARKLSAEDAEKLSKEMLAHHMSKMSMDDEKMGKHLADAKDEELSRMSKEFDEDKEKERLSKLSEEEKEKEEKKEKEAKMSAARDGFTKLALGIRKNSTELSTEIKKSKVAARLSKFRSEGKITPAEIKKLDIAKMAEMKDEMVDVMLSTFDVREPVIRFGSLAGTNKAENIEKVQKKYRMARLELESRLNMPSKRDAARAQLAKLAEEEKKELAHASEGAEEPTKGMLTKLSYDELCNMVDDKEKHEELKKHLKHMMDHHGVEVPEHSDAHMSGLVKKQVELQTNLEQLIALAAPALGIKSEEIK